MIEVTGLSVERGGTTILDGYGFTIARGSVAAILGANGVGKTSLINTIAGLLPAARGTVRCSARIGYVPQLFDVAFDYSVTDIVLMGRARKIGLFGSPRAADYAAVHRQLQALGIEHLAERSFNALSGGSASLWSSRRRSSPTARSSFSTNPARRSTTATRRSSSAFWTGCAANTA